MSTTAIVLIVIAVIGFLIVDTIRAVTAPVAGLNTGAVRPLVEGRSAPSIQCEITRTGGAISTADGSVVVLVIGILLE